MPYGYTGKILWIDLSEKKHWIESIPDKIYKNFLSGSGLGVYILYREIPPNADPLGQENILGFVSGMLTNTGSLFTGRWMVVAKSPLTGTWGESNCGGTLSPAIKRCGYDGIFIKGIGSAPVYVTVENEQVNIRNGDALWGLDTVESQKKLLVETNKSASIACIGTAGEKQSLISGIVNDGARIAARSGLGAVMGSKNLKALVVIGEGRTEVYDRTKINKLNRITKKWVKTQPPLPPGKVVKFAGLLLRLIPIQFALDGWFYKILLKKWGPVGFNQIAIEMGNAPIKNWRGTYRDFGLSKSKAIDPDHFIKHESIKYHCAACPLGCGGLYNGKDPINASHKPEYETVLAWSGLILNEDTKSLFELNDMLNRSGMDSISAGATVAFAVECYENGLISKEDMDGMALEWGNTLAFIHLLRKMIDREGIGDVLADGSLKAAERIGSDAIAYSMQAGGQELALLDTRYDPGLTLHAVVEATPGRHVRGGWQFYEMFRLWKCLKVAPKVNICYRRREKYIQSGKKAIMAIINSQFNQILDGCGFCLLGAFIGADRIKVFEYINAVSGWTYTAEEVMRIGKRIQTIKQMFNAREHIPLRHSINPRLLGEPPLKHGSAKGRRVHLDEWVSDYWQLMGWGKKNGVPSMATLRELGINEFVQEHFERKGGSGNN